MVKIQLKINENIIKNKAICSPSIAEIALFCLSRRAPPRQCLRWCEGFSVEGLRQWKPTSPWGQPEGEGLVVPHGPGSSVWAWPWKKKDVVTRAAGGGGGLSRPTGDPWRWWEGPSGGSESSVLAEIPSTPAKPLLIQLTKDCLFKFNFNFFPFREISWLQIKSNTLPVLQSLIPLTPYPKPIRFRLHHAF